MFSIGAFISNPDHKKSDCGRRREKSVNQTQLLSAQWKNITRFCICWIFLILNMKMVWLQTLLSNLKPLPLNISNVFSHNFFVLHFLILSTEKKTICAGLEWDPNWLSFYFCCFLWLFDFLLLLILFRTSLAVFMFAFNSNGYSCSRSALFSNSSSLKRARIGQQKKRRIVRFCKTVISIENCIFGCTRQLLREYCF